MPKIVDHEERREHFIDAAIDVVVREGFERLTMRQIATEAGYSHGAISRYFPDKQSLLAAAFLRLNQKVDERITENVGGLRGLAALESTCRAVLPYADRRNTARVIIAFWDRIPHYSDLREVWEQNSNRWRARFVQHLEEARDDDELHADIDVAVTVNEISARNMGWIMLTVLLPDEVSDDNLDRGLAALLDRIRTSTLATSGS